jgi:hypothetical protein
VDQERLMSPEITPEKVVADVVRDCLAWLDRQGFAAVDLAPTDAGAGVGEIVVQAYTYTFFVGVRLPGARPTRTHLHRQAHWMSQGAHSLGVRNARELEITLRSYLKF